MRYWITTDTHLGHDRLVEYGRPVDFVSRILGNLLRVVKEDDVLIHLGDICIGDEVYWHEQLMHAIKGKRWLVKGNHDRKSDTWYMNHGWDFVSSRICLERFGAKILFSHIPEDYGDEYECCSWWDINIHGHFHDSDHRKNEPEISAILSDKNILVALEHTNYMPVNLQKIIGKNYF